MTSFSQNPLRTTLAISPLIPRHHPAELTACEAFIMLAPPAIKTLFSKAFYITLSFETFISATGIRAMTALFHTA
jgi:acetate kinase